MVKRFHFRVTKRAVLRMSSLWSVELWIKMGFLPQAEDRALLRKSLKKPDVLLLGTDQFLIPACEENFSSNRISSGINSGLFWMILFNVINLLHPKALYETFLLYSNYVSSLRCTDNRHAMNDQF